MPTKIKPLMSGEILDKHSSRGGVYLLQEESFNGKIHWLQKSGDHAVWWSPNDKWTLGKASKIGSSTGFMTDATKSKNPPSTVMDGWHYWDGSEWKEASEENFIIQDLSNEKGRHTVLALLLPAGTIIFKPSNPRLLFKSVYYSRTGIIRYSLKFS